VDLINNFISSKIRAKEKPAKAGTLAGQKKVF
jgi:hypothetical protein